MRKEKQSSKVISLKETTGSRSEGNSLETDGEILQVRRVVAGNPNTPKQVLTRLGEDNSESIRRAVAENPKTPVDLLRKLAFDSHPEVRLAVAENIHTPRETLSLLANDENADVRYGVAENPHMPENILVSLARDENPYVRCRALKTLQMLAPDMQARLKLLLNPHQERLHGTT
jgi:hypothetical protein